MDKTKKRIKIAEACGWKWIWESPPAYVWRLYEPSNGGIYYSDLDPNADYPVHVLPDYLNDLNAMHDAEKVLNGSQGGDYDLHLWLIIQRDKTRPASWHATASQRAEAFGKTLNLWEDE